jgi:vancomycin permeability regulator SanA
MKWRRLSLLRLSLNVGLALLLLAVLAGVVPGAYAYFRYRSIIYSDPSDVPVAPVAIVFGAAIRPGGLPSSMLADRIDAAVALYKAGKVQQILMSGDNGSADYDEVTAMKRWAVQHGVPEDRIALDHAGFRTYDSCYRAKSVFGIDKAVLVTQEYHLHRALYLANSLGIDAVGLKAGLDSYPRQSYYDLREAAALAVSWYEINVTRPLPRYLGPPEDQRADS